MRSRARLLDEVVNSACRAPLLRACVWCIALLLLGSGGAEGARAKQRKRAAARVGAVERALLEARAAVCPSEPVRIDPMLRLAARHYVDAVKEGRAKPDGAELSFFASLDSIDPSSEARVATVDNAAQADRAVGDLLPKGCRYNVAGVASASLEQGHGIVAVLTALRAVEMAPIAAHAAPGASVRVDGKLTDQALSSPRLYHLIPGGSVEETPLALDGKRFQLEVVLAQRGEHALEVLADGPGGPEVVALRRIFVGVEAPKTPPAPLPAANGDGLAAVEQSIAQLRASRGLPPLARDPALDAIARGHSQEMARTQTFAHVLKSDGSIVDRVNRAGYAEHFVGENIGLAEDAVEAHQAIVESPAHLMNLLDPRHSRLGLGAASGLSPDGEATVYLTEVMAQPIIGSKDPIGDVAEIVSAERRRRKLPPLVRDPRLDALAQSRIQRVAESQGHLVDGDITKTVIDQISSLTAASAELIVAGTPEDARLSKDAATREWAVLGIGAVYANSKEYGPSRLWLLLIYAR